MDFEYTTSPKIYTTLNEQLPPISLVVSDGSTRRCIEEPTPALDTSFKADAHQDDLKKSSDTQSQADEELPENSDASPLFEAEDFMGAGYEYDTCFGVRAISDHFLYI
ncbi:hypothetical protein CMQ_4074 [Grosmannia clavigera kw1407]|uniref:Uncharacterized protein n=1 Tax=Grosmannia clavigera (strain kw1407 / UAMH 11150) TaxID=655863 RepID=F0X9D0_GROCL|nr:uncharacterized protein CMQ_4074 [Grosmannia clavigera kw1407]EFX06005.1 hypothetical protein CMQ_4074 [Grosmannia clavigera kw1407]